MSSSTITDPADIPTLTDLYNSGELPVYDDAEAGHDAALNSRVSIWRGEALSTHDESLES